MTDRLADRDRGRKGEEIDRESEKESKREGMRRREGYLERSREAE